MKVNKKRLIQKEDLEIVKKVGSGAFGDVMEGRLNYGAVAIKKLGFRKNDADAKNDASDSRRCSGKKQAYQREGCRGFLRFQQ